MFHQNLLFKPAFKLYTHHHSANGRKVLALTYALNLKPEIILVNPYQGEGKQSEYLNINPFGKIPTLVDGDFTLWESNAILQYISDKFGNNKLLSTDPQRRADISRWLFWESSHWQPAVSAVLAASVGHHLLPNILPAPANKPDWKHPEFARFVTYINDHLSKQPYLSGSQLSIADISVAGMMTYFRFAKFPFTEFQALSQWYERIEAMDFWRKSESELWKTSDEKPANDNNISNVPVEKDIGTVKNLT